MSRDYGRSFALRFLRMPACGQVAVAEPVVPPAGVELTPNWHDAVAAPEGWRGEN